MNDTTASAGNGATEPLISLVIPVFNVEAFLPAFLDSLAAQSMAAPECQIVFVNDGSTDRSADLVRAWIESTGPQAELVDQANHGLAAARNTGLERARGRWVSFPDPDDVLGPGYLTAVRSFLESRSGSVDLAVTRLLILDDETGEVTDTHPLHRRFQGGTRVVDLESSPETIHLSAATGFYRRARVEQLGLRFDPSIRPNFEDGFFTTVYLDALPTAQLGMVADAQYLYRRRADASSLVQQSWSREERYTTVLERGYLELLRRVREHRGVVPAWVQNVVLYDLLFYFRHDQSTKSATGRLPLEWTERFHVLAAEILSHIDAETIDRFAVMPTSPQLRATLIIGYKRERAVPAAVRIDKLDVEQRLARLRYFCAEPAPGEELLVGGRPVVPSHAKTRDLVYLNRVLLHERIAWVPATSELRFAIDGRPVPVELGAQPAAVMAASPRPSWLRLGDVRRVDGHAEASASRRAKAALSRRFPKSVGVLRRLRRSVPGVAPRPTPIRTSPFVDLDPRDDGAISRAARSEPIARRYARAWTFMDRDTEAHDNAEHLYRHVRAQHPEVNAWFVLRRDSGDWARLEEDGFLLVPYGSADHVQLLLNTDHLVSSQADNYVARPLDPARFGTRAWKFTFLQHGVTKDDLSRWFNGMPIDRLITASTTEHASIVGDHTPYVLTDQEVRLTGFPRHDRLLELGRSRDRPDVILVMPTWRRWLLADLTNSNARRMLEPLGSSAFWRSWSELISSTELKAIAEAAGLELVLLPHPNLHEAARSAGVPEWVQLHGYETSDVQDLLARAAVNVTDYSSQAFEAAYLERPVVYYQFDHDEFFSGTHVYRKGTWDYEADGFGPVTRSLDEAIRAIREAIVSVEPAEPFRSRMRAAFPYRDGRCCERTFESIVSLMRPAAEVDVLRVVGPQGT